MHENRPNILFVLCDQLRWDCFGFRKHPVVDTPNLDQIAQKGICFTSAYSSCPSCIAARASIWTGLSPSSHGRLGYSDGVPWNYEKMLPQMLSDAGYQTHCVGKTHFYPQRKHCGFQSIDSYEAAQNLDGDYINDYHEWLREKSGGNLRDFDHGLDSNSWSARPSHLPEELHNNSWVVTKGIEFVRRRDKTRPFFLNLSFHRPHPPIDPPQVFFDLYKDRELAPVPVGDWAQRHECPISDLNAWRGQLSPRLLNQARRAYYAQVAHIDNQIGRMMLAIRHLKVGPTVVIFTSDHGEMLGDHHLFRKTYAYEGSAAVPFLISHPEYDHPGRFNSVPVVLEDIYPTVLDIAGIDIPSRTEGMSLLPCLKGDQLNNRTFVHGEHSSCYHQDEAMQFMTDGKEKYIWFTANGREQLFDLQQDPYECHDLANEANAKENLRKWRMRLVQKLAERPQDGLSDGKNLLPGLLPAVRPQLLTTD